MTHILHIDSSARRQGSSTRELAAATVDRLLAENPDANVTYRDLGSGEPFISETWVAANFTPKESRTKLQIAELKHSDMLIAELLAADIIVVGMPVYNFGIAASLKAWFDQIARVGKTFHYTENGPQGLVNGKKVIVEFASGGTPLGAPFDFASPYLRHMFEFIGITDVTFNAPETAEKAA